MAVRRRSRIWTQQPQGPLEIDWSNPLTKGLYIAFDARINRDLVSGKFGGYGSAANVVSKYGVGKNNVSANQLATNVPIPALPLSIIVLTKPVAWGGQQQTYITHGVGGSGGYGFSLPGNSLRFTHYGVADYNATASSWDGSVTDDSQIKCVGCTNNGSSILFYDRGVQIGTSVAVGGYNQGSADIHALTCGAQNPQSKEYLALAWSRALSPEEHKLLSDNPWQIFTKKTRRRLISAGAGGPTAYTLDSQPGSVSVVGSAATLKAARKLSASPGAVSIVGASATLKRSLKLSASAGAVAITGAAASLKVTRKLSANAGAVTIAGATAELVYTAVGASPVLNAESGSIAISGATATLKATRKLSADAGSITIVGASATMVKYFAGLSLNAQPGAVTIAGAVAGFRRTYKFIALPGSVAITGATASMVYTGATGQYTRAPSGAGPTVIQPGSYRPSNTGGRRY